jgi:drug/metabolite transporter (DMT)-like permease
VTHRSSWWLFLTPVVIWSTTFYAITYQLKSPTPEVYSVAFRFLIASGLVFLILFTQKKGASMSGVEHGLAATSGMTAYGLSYVLTYVSERVIPSGLVAIAFTLMVFLTPLFARFAYGERITRATWIGGSLGVAGVALCFAPGVFAQGAQQLAFWAVCAMLIAAAASSVSAVISIKLNRRQVPVTVYTAWAMLYGSLATFAYGAASGASLQWDARPSFWIAFTYLTVFGTVFAFLCYLELMRKEGAARAMYIGVLSPIGALLVSLALEGLRIDLYAWTGITLALIGAYYTLRHKAV